jgi:hypothetical protein
MSNEKKQYKPGRRFHQFIGHCRIMTEMEPMRELGDPANPLEMTEFFGVFGAAPYEKEEVALGVRFVGRTAEQAVKYLKKGMEVIVSGALRQYSKKEDGRDRPRVYYSVAADRFSVVKWPERESPGEAPKQSEFTPTEPKPATHGGGAVDTDQDAPF